MIRRIGYHEIKKNSHEKKRERERERERGKGREGKGRGGEGMPAGYSLKKDEGVSILPVFAYLLAGILTSTEQTQCSAMCFFCSSLTRVLVQYRDMHRAVGAKHSHT